MEREYRITNTDLLVTSILLSKKAPQKKEQRRRLYTDLPQFIHSSLTAESKIPKYSWDLCLWLIAWRAIFSWGGRGRGSGSESARMRRLRESDKVDYVK